MEAYGLVGLFVTIQNVSRLFDLGIPVLVNRELARMSVAPGPSQARSFVSHMEWIYWGLAAIVGVILLAAIPFASRQWLRPVNLDPADLRIGLQLIALVTVIHWPVSLYTGGLLGLQKQASLAGAQGIIATIRAFGAWALLEYSPTLQAFFLWQLFISLVSTLLFRAMLRVHLPSRTTTRVSWSELGVKMRAAISFSGIGILSIPLMQMDKVLLSRLLSLENYGKYMLVCTISTSLYMAINAVYGSVFPRLSQVAALGDELLLRREYLRGTQLMGTLLFPAVCVLALFPSEILAAWTGDPVMDVASGQVLGLLAIGTSLHGLAHLPGALQFACGETRLSLVVNLASLVGCVPMIWFLTLRYGMLGGGVYSVALNAGMLLVHIIAMHRRFLRTARMDWVRTNAILLLVAVVVPLLGRFLLPMPSGRFASAVFVGLLFLVSACATFGLRAEFREALLRSIGRRGACPG